MRRWPGRCVGNRYSTWLIGITSGRRVRRSATGKEQRQWTPEHAPNIASCDFSTPLAKRGSSAICALLSLVSAHTLPGGWPTGTSYPCVAIGSGRYLQYMPDRVLEPHGHPYRRAGTYDARRSV